MTVTTSSRARLASLLGVFVLLAASCGLTSDIGNDVAATVTLPDGSIEEISTAELDELYDPLVADVDFVAGAYAGEVPAGLRGQMLTDLVVDRVVDDVLVVNGVTVSESAEEEGTERLVGAVASVYAAEADPTAAAEASFDSIPYLPFLAGLQAKQISLGEALSADAAPGEVVEIPCSSHILVESEDEALDVLAELESGADFAEVAIERSIGPSGPSGGVLGCTDPNGFVPEFRDAIVGAPVGTYIGPVQTEFGFHVITVTDVEEQEVGAPDPQDLAISEIVASMSQIEVDVDPTIGEWDNAQNVVVQTSTD